MAKKSPFTQEFLDKIKTALEQERERIAKELSGFTKKNPHVSGDFDATYPEYGSEEDDNAREIADYTANKPLELSLEKTLRDVDKALERLKKGTYGICKYCDKPIDEKRLLARPTSGACVSCKKTLTDEI
jgi:RNA polymerase-binding transcription factor DksA